jgi:hypothetical protein
MKDLSADVSNGQVRDEIEIQKDLLEIRMLFFLSLCATADCNCYIGHEKDCVSTRHLALRKPCKKQGFRNTVKRHQFKKQGFRNTFYRAFVTLFNWAFVANSL